MHGKGNLYEDKEIASNVRKYEAMKKSGVFAYFDVDEYLMIIDYYMQNGQENRALEACETAIGVHGDVPELVIERAQIQISQGHADIALQAINSVESLMSDNYDFYLTKASALLQTGDSSEFIKCFDKALKLSCDADPEERESIIFNIGEMLESCDMFDIALRFYQIAADEFPDNIDFLFKIGICYENLGKSDKSIEIYNKAIDIDPFSESAWYNLGIVYNKIGEFDKALEAYNFATTIDPSFYDAIFNKGNTYCNAGNHAAALECYKEYLKEYPASLSAQCYIGECYIHTDQLDEAERCFDSIIRMFEDYADAWYGKAMVFNARNDIDKAIEALHKALAIDPEHDVAWFHLGRLLNDCGDLAEAEKAIEKSIELNKYYENAWDLLGVICFEQMKIKKVIERMREATDFYLPNESSLLYMLAAAYLLEGEEKLGMEKFNQAYHNNPDLCERFFIIMPKRKLNSTLKAIYNKLKKK